VSNGEFSLCCVASTPAQRRYDNIKTDLMGKELKNTNSSKLAHEKNSLALVMKLMFLHIQLH
jgi:hypothetical protein